MSRTKQLKELPENNINLYNLFSFFSPEKKSKYTELLLRLMKNTPNLNDVCGEVKYPLKKEFNFVDSDFENIHTMEILFFYKILESLFEFSDLRSYQKFCQFNEKGLIKQNDLSKYKSLQEILNQVSVTELIAETKILEKQIKIVYEDETWILIRPLTFVSSKKYGSNTKWCTTTENNPEYFYKYTKKGILIYCINKKTGYKVASFCSLDVNDPEFSFWDQKDNKIDSLITELTDELRGVILKECTSKDKKTNFFLLPETERIKEEELIKRNVRIAEENVVTVWPSTNVTVSR